MACVDNRRIGDALVDFSLHGVFPEEDLSSRQIAVEDLAPALESLASAKAKLEAEIHQINEETASDVDQWVANAKSLEDDINKTRTWANDIARRSEAPDVSGKTILEVEEKVEFLLREADYNRQVHSALTSIKHVNELLDQVEQARDERRILDSLHLLEKSWAALDDIPVSKSCRAMRILNVRAFELKSAVHDVFDHVWKTLVQIDGEAGRISIFDTRENEQMSLSDAVVGLKAYKEVDQRMALLWHSLDDAIVKPRTNIEREELPSINIEGSTLQLGETTDKSVTSLFSDLAQVLTFLSERLPEELVFCLSNVMMPDLIPRITTVWLESAVPPSLVEMGDFQNITEATREFCLVAKNLNFFGIEELAEWVENLPRVWLAKRREAALDAVRAKLIQGLGESKEVERTETQTVSRSEGQQIAANGPAAVDEGDEDAWGAAWDDDEGAMNGNKRSGPVAKEDDGADAWGWGDEGEAEADQKPATAQDAGGHASTAGEDDAADAWGWGDEDTAEAEPQQASSSKSKPTTAGAPARELTLKETYHISSMPEPVLALISSILEDGRFLLNNEANPVSPAAAGLFSLPTLVLDMFRAVSPYYYALENGGNMFLYNDATYLAERLGALEDGWRARGGGDDLGPRARDLLRLRGDAVEALSQFAARAYAAEMATQRTILRDLLGGSQNLLQQDGLGAAELTAQVDGAAAHVRAVAGVWAGVLARSAWCQAVGALVDAAAARIVADVMELDGIGQDEAFDIAHLIARVTELDDLFLPSPPAPGAGDRDKDDNTRDKDADADAAAPVPATAEYAASWLRLKYLSEVLQSNLQDVRYLWMESELSLYFTVDEVVYLVGLSFVDNARTRQVVHEIKATPHPVGL
ncbi:hypothetical protein GGR56DRAFT_682024 [Xylariaceae sp. FL0804]|nr:hypothetical protein GGR56DRAFT_682024 [Xylariaceae sp. FL0804]